MKPTLLKLLGIHLLIILGFGVWGLVMQDRDLQTFLFMSGITALALSILDLLVGLVLLATKQPEDGRQFLACGGILLLAGFSTCMGGLMTTGKF